MIDLRRKKRMDIVRNSRYKHLSKTQNLDDANKIENEEDEMFLKGSTQHPFPTQLSHLEKVPDAQRILNTMKDVKNHQLDPKELRVSLDVIQKGSRFERHRGIMFLRVLLQNNPKVLVQKVIDANGVVLLRNLARDSTELHLRFEALGCLKCLLLGNKEQVSLILEKGILGLFNDVLVEAYPQMKNNALEGLINVLDCDPKFRAIVLEEDLADTLADVLAKRKFIETSELVVECFVRILHPREKDESLKIMKKPVKSIISFFVKCTNDHTKGRCLFAIYKYCRDSLLPFFLDDNFLETMKIFYEKLERDYTKHAIFREEELLSTNSIIAMITAGDDFDTAKILNTGFMPTIARVFQIEHQKCRKKVLWILTNFAVGTSGQISYILENKLLFETLVDIVYSPNVELSHEALWVLASMTRGCNDRQLRFLLDQNLLGIFKEFLLIDQKGDIVLLIIEAINYVLDRADLFKSEQVSSKGVLEMMGELGFDEVITGLQRHESEEVYEKCLEVMEKYFELEEY